MYTSGVHQSSVSFLSPERLLRSTLRAVRQYLELVGAPRVMHVAEPLPVFALRLSVDRAWTLLSGDCGTAMEHERGFRCLPCALGLGGRAWAASERVEKEGNGTCTRLVISESQAPCYPPKRRSLPGAHVQSSPTYEGDMTVEGQGAGMVTPNCVHAVWSQPSPSPTTLSRSCAVNLWRSFGKRKSRKQETPSARHRSPWNLTRVRAIISTGVPASTGTTTHRKWARGPVENMPKSPRSRKTGNEKPQRL